MKVWDPRQKDDPVATMEPGEGETKRDCWTVAFGKTTTGEEWAINSLPSGGCCYNLKLVIFKLISRIDILSIYCEFALKWMPQDLIDDKSTLVLQVMVWRRQSTSHYLSQCWVRSMSRHMASLGHNELTHPDVIWGILCYRYTREQYILLHLSNSIFKRTIINSLQLGDAIMIFRSR